MTLDKHLGNTRCATEVAVNLEGGMGIEHVGVGATLLTASRLDGGFDLLADERHRMVAVEEACPEADFPAHRPACGGVTSGYEAGAGGAEEVGRAVGRDLIAWVESPEVRDVAVVVVGIIPILHPFLQLAPAPNLHRSKLVVDGLQGVDEEGIVAQLLCRADAVGKEVVDELVVHRGAIDDSDATAWYEGIVFG